MPTPKPSVEIDTSAVDLHIADLDKIAKDGAGGDTVTVALAKGFMGGLTALVAMIKGTGRRDEDEETDDEDSETDEGGGADGGEGGGGEGGEGGEGDGKRRRRKPPEGGEGGGGDGGEGGGGGPGYDDMRMGGGADGEFVDATEYVLALEKKIDGQGKDIKALCKSVRQLTGLVGEMAKAQAEVLAPMAKAVMDTHGALSRLPDTMTPAVLGRRAGAAHALEEARKNADGGVTMVKLSKALGDRVITEDQFRAFKHTGRFVEDDGANNQLVEKVKALA